MLVNARCENANLTGKILAAGGRVGIVKPKRLPQRQQAVAGNGPVRNFVMDGLRPHGKNVQGCKVPGTPG